MPCDHTIQFDLSTNGKNKFDGLSNEVIEVEAFQFERYLFQQAAHPPDDFTGTPVVLQNIVHYLVQFGNVRAGRFQDCFCGFGVRQNGAERLVDFMSNRGGQFASRGDAVDMDKFGRALPGLQFGQTTPTMRTLAGPR